MRRVQFRAREYCSDQSFADAEYEFVGDAQRGFAVTRGSQQLLALGPGYQLMRSEVCGVCSTDLARHYLPFPLPQITGHEVVLTDETGRRYVCEINASHRARGVSASCPYCAGGLDTHCAERLVLGIHDLPGGFGPWLLAPVNALLPVPDSIPTNSAVLVEPFAAALHAARTVDPKPGESVAVLGPRRLGLLVIAALAAVRQSLQLDYRIVALSRHSELLALAKLLGADAGLQVEGDGHALAPSSFDCVIDTTGNPLGLELALRLARREVHVKSTHGRPAAGLQHLTEMVVDELALARFDGAIIGDGAKVAWLTDTPPPPALAERVHLSADPDESAPLRLLDSIERTAAPGELPRFDFAVVDSARKADLATRPSSHHQRALVRPRGTLLVHPRAARGGPSILDAVAGRGLRLSTSRCGDFRSALALMESDAALRALGDRFVTHYFRAEDLASAFEMARSTECIKAVVEQQPASWQ